MIIRIIFYELVSGSYYWGDMVPPIVDRNSNIVVHTILALEIGYKNKYRVYHTMVYNVYKYSRTLYICSSFNSIHIKASGYMFVHVFISN